MNSKKENPKITKVEEPAVVYESSKIKSQGIDRATFDFDAEFEKGLTLEEFKSEMAKRIRGWWGK